MNVANHHLIDFASDICTMRWPLWFGTFLFLFPSSETLTYVIPYDWTRWRLFRLTFSFFSFLPSPWIVWTTSSKQYNFQSFSFSCIDVVLCSSSVLPFLSWHRHSSFYGSNHYLILLTEASKDTSPDPQPQRWCYEKVDLASFRENTYGSGERVLEDFSSVVLTEAASAFGCLFSIFGCVKLYT